MPLTLVLGPANSAKAGEVLGAYAEAAPRGALLVVPNIADADHYGRELARQGCVLRSVLTFAGLTERIAHAAGYATPRLSSLQRERVILRAVRGCSLSALDSASETPGFAGAVGDLIAELGRSMISPQRFARALRGWAAGEPRRQAYAADVAAICLAYERELDRLGLVDAELFAWRALDALRGARSRWPGEPVFFYGFDDLTPLERDAVETLSRVVGVEVMVSITFEPGRNAFAAGAELVAELAPLAERVVELPARVDFYAPASREALHHLERHLFEGSPGEPMDPGSSIGLLEAAGQLAESELVASEVLALLRAGVPAAEIAVVYRSLDQAAGVIDRTFRRYGIPCALERPLRFAATALGRGLLGLARCALLGGELAAADDLLAYLHTPGVMRRIELADRADLEARCAGISTADALRERVGLRLSEIETLADASDPVSELVRQGRRLLSVPIRSQAQVLDSEAELDALALARLLELSAELKQLGEAPAPEELIRLLEDLELRPPPRAHGGVLVSDPLAIRARRFQVVFVCGLQEGVFPRTGAGEPFLADELRRELAFASGLRLRPTEDVLPRERYLFYSCLSRATERVILSYQSSDEEGNLKRPSPFVADVEALLDAEWPLRRRRRSLADVVWPVEEAPSPRERARSVAAMSAPAAGEPVAPEHRLHARALAAVRHTRLLSAGALESYAECPVKWLVERELEPQQLEPEAEPLARGSYAHDLLEQILRGLGGPVTPESLPEALRLLDERLRELSPRLAPGHTPELRHAVAEGIAGDLRRYLEHDASCGCGWEPRELELRFGFAGEEGSLPALSLGGDGEPVLIRGAIDRIDVEPGGPRAVVRDYKSGAARPGHRGTNWRSEQRLQVALYMIAARDLLGLEPVAGLYQPLGGKDLRARGIYLDGAPVGSQLVANDARNPEELAADLDDARERAVALATQLREGWLDRSPATCSRDGCRYPGICRSQ